MTTIEIARRLAALNQKEEACKAYTLALHQSDGTDPAAELEAAIYILQTGGDYKLSFTCFCDLYNRGYFRSECLNIVLEAFYLPNIKKVKNRYEKNWKRLAKYPYLFQKEPIPFEQLPILFIPYDDNSYVPYYLTEERFGNHVNFRDTVITRNFFKDLENPILATDVFSQYELEYLYDNVRKSEWVGRENHIYLHYTDWAVFCSYLQVLNMRPLLEDKKIVFLIGDEIAQYPIDFKERFGIDYSQYEPKPVGIREVNRLIWHTQLSTHNGGDFFNEIFDDHPNLICMPSIMWHSLTEEIKNASEFLLEGKVLHFNGKPFIEELYRLKGATLKDIFVAAGLSDNCYYRHQDRTARIAPAFFCQPHFPNICYKLEVDGEKNTSMLYSEEYEQLRTHPMFQGFKYIKTFTPMRRITNSYGATVKFMLNSIEKNKKEDKYTYLPDTVAIRVLNRSFMIDREDRLYRDSVLVRFEDGKLNPKATFTALAAFLDLPYTESMTYCSFDGKRDPESLAGNDLGFSPAALYRTYDDYANDSERCFIEYFMRDVYQCYGYDFWYYDGKPLEEERIEELVDDFTKLDGYIRISINNMLHNKIKDNTIKVTTDEKSTDSIEALTQAKLDGYRKNRLFIAETYQRELRFVNKRGQPLVMMPLLKLDPALLEQPLYH